MDKNEIDQAINVMMFLRYKMWVIPPSSNGYIQFEPTEEEKQKAYEVCLKLLNEANKM